MEKLCILAGESQQRRVRQLIAKHTVGSLENLSAPNGNQVRPPGTGANQIYKTFFHNVQPVLSKGGSPRRFVSQNDNLLTLYVP